MSRPAKVALGLATVLPFLLIGAFVGILAATVLQFPEAPVGNLQALSDEFFEAFVRHFVLVFACIVTLFLAIALSLAMPLIFVLHALKSDGVGEEQRTTWVVVLLLGGILVAPFYWYLHVWRGPPTA